MVGSGSSIRPPDDEVPANVPFSMIVGRTSSLALALADISVYSTGFSFATYLFARDSRSARVFESWSSSWHLPQPATDFELTVTYPDRTTFSVARVPQDVYTKEAVRPLMHLRGSIAERFSQLTVFVSPLPPEGTVSVTCEWPSQGLTLTKAELESVILLGACARIIRVWDLPAS